MAIHRKGEAAFVHQAVVGTAQRHEVCAARPAAIGDEGDVMHVDVAVTDASWPAASAVTGEHRSTERERDLPGLAFGHHAAIWAESERGHAGAAREPLDRVRRNDANPLDVRTALGRGVRQHLLVDVDDDRRVPPVRACSLRRVVCAGGFADGHERVGSGGGEGICLDVRGNVGAAVGGAVGCERLAHRLDGGHDRRAVLRGEKRMDDHHAVLVARGIQLPAPMAGERHGSFITRRAAKRAHDPLELRSGGVVGHVDERLLEGRRRDPGDRPHLGIREPSGGEGTGDEGEPGERPADPHMLPRHRRAHAATPREPVRTRLAPPLPIWVR